MADVQKQARMALLAALDPAQFIEMAVQQGFHPDKMKAATGVGGKKAPPTDAERREEQDSALKRVAAPPMGAPPVGQLPASPSLTQGERAAGFDDALRKLAPPGMTTAPPMGAAINPQPPVAPPPPMTGTTTAGSLPNQTPLWPGIQMPSRMPAPIDMAAGGLAGLLNGPTYSPEAPTAPPAQVPAPPPGVQQPPLPTIGSPPIEQPSVWDVLTRTLAGAGGPQTPSAPTVPSESISGSALSNIAPKGSGLEQFVNLPWGNLVPPGSALDLMMNGGQAAGPGAGLSSPAMPGVVPPTVLPPAAPATSPPPVVAPPPTAQPPEIASGPALKKVSSAGVEAASPTKEGAASGKPKSTAEQLAQVGKLTGGGRARSGGGGVGGAGIRQSAIQQGELMDLILRSLLKPAQYNPGFIPLGKV